MSDNLRKLTFTGRRVENLIQDSNVSGLSIENQVQFPDMDTKIPLAVQWTNREYTSILSAISAGAFLISDDDAMEIIDTFLLITGGDMSFCDEIANCIDTSTNVQNSLDDYLSETGQNGGSGNTSQPLPPSIMATNIIPQNALCTNDNRYAMARAIVQELDRLSEDFLDIIALISARNEIASEIVEGIPIFGGLASLALDAADWVTNNVKTSYSAAYSAVTETDYSCAVYCAYDGCDLTWDDVIAVYETQASITPPTGGDFISTMQWFFTNVVGSTDNIIVGAMHLFILNSLKYGSNWFGSGIWTTLEIAVQDASDEEITVPSGCVCQTTWCNYFDWTTGQQDFLVTGHDRPYGVYVPSVGFQATWNSISSINDNRAYPRRDFGVSFTPDTWEIEYIGTAGGNSRQLAMVGYLAGSVVFSHSFGTYDLSGTIQTAVYNGSHTVDDIRVQFVSDLGAPDQDCCTLVSLKISGTSGTPPVSENCP